MKIVGCDLHTRYQQIAMLDEETGELMERRLEHDSGEARSLLHRSGGSGASGDRSHRTHALVRAHAGRVGTRVVDRRRCPDPCVRWCASRRRMRATPHLLELLLSGRFPRIWRPTPEERDLRQLVWHRQKLVWMRNAVGNQLHALAMGEGRVPEEEAVHQERPRRA